MKRTFTVSLFLVTVVGIMSGATITFSGPLSGSNENPPISSPATGSATVTLDTIAHTLTIDLNFANLTSNTMAAHIHCCVQPPGNAGVATTVPAFPGFPLGVTSGTYHGVLNLLDAGSYNPTFVTNNGSLANAAAVFETGLQNSQTYLNIHTVQNPGGEVRTSLTTSSVPEPGTSVLAMTGAAAIIFIRRLRRRGSANDC